jgi:hypothetical protein
VGGGTHLRRRKKVWASPYTFRYDATANRTLRTPSYQYMALLINARVGDVGLGV